MKNALRAKLTYANVISTACLFLLLSGGAAYAATQLAKNSVGTNQLKSNAVTTAKLKSSAVTGDKVKDGSLTGADIDASSLGQVPNAGHAGSADQATSASNATNAAEAAKLQGHPAADFLAVGATAADSNKLGGLDSIDFGSVESARFTAEPLGSSEFAELFAPISGVSEAVEDLELVSTLSPARTTVARDLAVKLSDPVTANAVVEVFLVEEGASVLLHCTILPGEFACTDTTDAVEIEPGKEIAIALYEETGGASLPELGVMTGFRLAAD